MQYPSRKRSAVTDSNPRVWLGPGIVLDQEILGPGGYLHGGHELAALGYAVAVSEIFHRARRSMPVTGLAPRPVMRSGSRSWSGRTGNCAVPTGSCSPRPLSSRRS